MINFVTAILSFILVFVIVVIVHEYGHFWVARRLGVRVLRFSVGFGPVLWKKIDKYGTEFVIGSIPLGGYVKMLDGREQTLTEAEKPYAFDQKPVGKRIAVVVAGPLFNFLFAIFAFAIVLTVGIEKIAPIIAHVDEGSPAALAGIKTDDEFVSVGGKPTDDWQSVYFNLLQHVGETGNIDVVVRQFPDKPLREYSLPLPSYASGEKNAQRDPLNAWGITLGLPHVPAILGEIVPNEPAARAGLQKGDKVLMIDHKPIKEWYDLVEYIRTRPNQPILFTIERAGETLQKTVTPEEQELEGQTIGVIGVKLSIDAWPAELNRTHRENILQALYLGVVNTWDLSILTFDIMGKMLTGMVGIDNLAGPISIAQGAQQSVESGWMSFMSFLILLSVNLGVINLLPIPMLDGGHLLYYVLELFRGKPVSEKAQRVGLVIGLVFIVGLMLVGLHNDVTGLNK